MRRRIFVIPLIAVRRAGEGMGPSGTLSAVAALPLGLGAYASLGLREGPPSPYPRRPREISLPSMFKISNKNPG